VGVGMLVVKVTDEPVFSNPPSFPQYTTIEYDFWGKS